MITITDQPYDYTPVGQKLMVCMISTNYLNAGFRFILSIPSINVTLYLQPNPSGTGMLDLCPILRERLRHTAMATASNINPEYSAHFSDQIEIVEGWLVGGIFTENPEGDKPVRFKINFFLANYEISDGYKPDPNVRYALDSADKYLLSERTEQTNLWQQASEFSLDNNCIYIPARQEDWGLIMSVIYCPSQLTTEATDLYIEFFDIDGTSLSSVTYTLDTGVPDHNNYVGIYPQNLDADGVLPPDWYFYILTAIDALGDKKSRSYVYYKVPSDCRFDNVRLMWTNTCGGVDYFNFNKKSEVNYTLDRKQYTQVIGTYAETDFKFNTYDRGITDRMVIATKGMVVNSDWLSKGEFELLKTLLISNDVFIVDDDGNQIPVVVDESSYVVKDDRYSRLFNLTIKLKFSQPVGI